MRHDRRIFSNWIDSGEDELDHTVSGDLERTESN